jgi:catalase (peroxidase I)
MKYSTDILKKLNEIKGEQLPSRIKKASNDIVSAYNTTVGKMKNLPNLGDTEAAELASAAISSAVKEEGVVVEVGPEAVHMAKNETNDIKSIEDIEASEEDYEDYLKTKQAMETNEQNSPKVNKKMALLRIKDDLENYMDMFTNQMDDNELRRVADAIVSLASVINLTESKIKITKGQLGTLIENVKKENK